MMSNLAAALITHGRIETTLTKAKALRPFIEKVITKAKQAAAKTEKKDALHLRRLALRDVRDEDAVTLLFNEKYKEFTNPQRRLHPDLQARAQRMSDAAEMALIEFVKADDQGYKKSKGRKRSGSKAKKAASPRPPRPRAAPAPAEAPAKRRSRRPGRPPRSRRAEVRARCDAEQFRGRAEVYRFGASYALRGPPGSCSNFPVSSRQSTACWSPGCFLSALWLYYDRRDHERFERERRKTTFHCIRCERLYTGPSGAELGSCPRCGHRECPAAILRRRPRLPLPGPRA
jgi:large subunit ribosomal protein L17